MDHVLAVRGGEAVLREDVEGARLRRPQEVVHDHRRFLHLGVDHQPQHHEEEVPGAVRGVRVDPRDDAIEGVGLGLVEVHGELRQVDRLLLQHPDQLLVGRQEGQQGGVVGPRAAGVVSDLAEVAQVARQRLLQVALEAHQARLGLRHLADLPQHGLHPLRELLVEARQLGGVAPGVLLLQQRLHRREALHLLLVELHVEQQRPVRRVVRLDLHLRLVHAGAATLVVVVVVGVRLRHGARHVLSLHGGRRGQPTLVGVNILIVG
mmetsp:Transcript_34887/g.89597  ORF Transcript_34887/g.89597 Transcript_34887/m.89597 type:complete len:264 (-) Transcript_34887:1251-2042(-)